MGHVEAGLARLRALAPALALLLAAAPLTLALALLVAPAPPALARSAAAVLAAHPPPLVERLMREKIVVVDPGSNGDGSMVTALVVFEQPRGHTLHLLSETARQAEYRPELKRIETVERRNGTSIDEHRMKIMFMQIDYRVRTRYDPKRSRISWKIDPSFENDLQDLEGFWELYELDARRTLGRFGTRVSVGPALPVWVQDYATRKNLPQTMDRMRRWVDSDGTYRP